MIYERGIKAMKKLVTLLSALALVVNGACLTASATEVYTESMDINVAEVVNIVDDVKAEFNCKQVEGVDYYAKVEFSVPTSYFVEGVNTIKNYNATSTLTVTNSDDEFGSIAKYINSNVTIQYEKDGQLYEVPVTKEDHVEYDSYEFDGSVLKDADTVKVVYVIENDDARIYKDTDYSEFMELVYGNTYTSKKAYYNKFSILSDTEFTINLELDNATEQTDDAIKLSLTVANSEDTRKNADGSEATDTTSSSKFLDGDVNHDGVVNLIDLLIMWGYM